MQMLARKEQEQVVLTFEQDYGKLVMECNTGIEKKFLSNKATELLVQIKKAAVPSYFEEDMLEVLNHITTSILKVVK